MTVQEAIRVLAEAGAVFSVPEEKRHLSLAEAAARLDVSKDWVRGHLDEFPNAWRLPAGSAGERNVGELRIPVRDLDALAKRSKIQRA